MKAAKKQDNRLWIGNQPNPDDRFIITVSPEDDARAHALRGDRTGKAIRVTDIDTNKRYTIQAIDCGLDCWCALGLVDKKKPGRD